MTLKHGWLMAAALVSAGVQAADTSSTAPVVRVQGTGSSFAYPLYKTWAADYYKSTGRQVNYTPTGSGAGIKAVTAREVDFGGSDKPLKPKTLKKKKLYQFPAAIGAITLSYNVPEVDQLKLSSRAVAGIALGSVRYWDAPVLAQDNPGVKLPHKPILFVHRSDSSGTTFAFSYYLSKISRKWRKTFGARKQINWPMDNRAGGKGNFGVATAIKTNPYSIGYVEYADARKAGLKMAQIEGADGQYHAPSLDSFRTAARFAKLDPARDFYANIQYPKQGYPIVAATFVLVPAETERAERSRNVVDFFDHGFRYGDVIATKLGYVALPDSVKEKIRAYWKEKGLIR